MRLTNCSNCNTTDVPLNHTLNIDGQVHCADCIKEHYPHKKMFEGKKVVKDYDPTVCHFCNKDFGEHQLGTLSVYPVCDNCKKEIKDRTLPLWVKGFFAAILLIVVFSFIWNWKYYEAYNNIQNAFSYFEAGKATEAKNEMAAAHNKVPEVADLALLTTYFEGLELLYQDKGAEALVKFNECKGQLPDSYNLGQLLTSARYVDAFNRQDYKAFLEASKERLAADSTAAISYASVASAYACLYAKGDESAKAATLEYLDKAKAIDTANTEKSYYNAIEYRLYTKKIIDKKIFDKQFPNGWVKN